MSDAKGRAAAQAAAGRFLGSLKEALHAAGKPDACEAIEVGDMTVRTTSQTAADSTTPSAPAVTSESQLAITDTEPTPKATAAAHVPSAAEAAREARGAPAQRQPNYDAHIEFDGPVTRIVRSGSPGGGQNQPGQNHLGQNDPGPNSLGKSGAHSAVSAPTAARSLALDDSPRTQVLRGRQSVARGEFRQDPVVGWLVVVGGKGLGNYRPIFEGNNAIGRAPSNRIPIDFGDDTISSEEQAYIRYDSSDRSFLLVPNLAKTNVVALNDKRPTAAVAIHTMDVITMGRTQLVFVPFCGPDFDWSELGELGG